MPRLVFALCLAEILGMAGFAAFPALLPDLMLEWSLTNTGAGWISGIYYAGYTAAVPVLASLTDKIDPRRIYVASTALAGLALLGFALIAQGFWTAFACQALAGVGLAGTFMPGLKILSDHVGGPHQSRFVSFYTASFSIGVGFSFLLVGQITAWLGWRLGLGLVTFCPLAAIGVIAWQVSAEKPNSLIRQDTKLLDFRAVLRARPTMGYILGYAAHMWELFAMRSWIVAFLAFSQSLQPAGALVWSATVVAGIVNLAQVLASVGGNELAMRFGRRRVVILIMTTSALLACVIGFTAGLPFFIVVVLCLLYGVTVDGDSGALTAGALAAAPAGYRGATLAVHSTLGFGMGFMGSLTIGTVLDLAGRGTTLAWGLAFAVVGLGCAGGLVALALLRPQRE